MTTAAARPRLLFLILAVCGVSICLADDGVFLASIDCGSTESYTDTNKINWTGDGNYVDGGEAKTVRSASFGHVLDTLRVFTSPRRKNCYQIDSIRKGRVLVRAKFYYGNYDGKSSPPTFDLILDGIHWETANTSADIGYYIFYEVVYVVTTGSISVCVAQTREGEYPFISALEVRGLESTMYQQVDDSNPLNALHTFAYGSKNDISYPDDPHDRLWIPPPAGNQSGLTTLYGNFFVNSSSVRDKPPPLVFQTAISSINANSTIPLELSLPVAQIQAYIIFYFAEVVSLTPTQVRSFRIFKNGLPWSNSIRPSNKTIIEIYVANLTYTSNTSFSLVPDQNATLPPLINALELYQIVPKLSNGTDGNDVSSLALLQDTFDVLKGWRGDPCLPASYSWDWIKCNQDSTPRVTELLLGSYGLLRMIPYLSSMDALETIDLQNNSINGPIPEFFAKFPNLKELILRDNNFSGTIPTSLLQKSGLRLLYTGNPYLCTSSISCLGDHNKKNSPRGNSVGADMKSKTRTTLFAITIPSFFILSIIILV